MMDDLKVAICEDCKSDRDRLGQTLAACSIPTSLTYFSSGEELLSSYVPCSYDLILMDIFMKGMSGVEAVRNLRSVDPQVPVVFVTTSREFTAEGYSLSVIAYIMKPFERQDLEKVLRLAYAIRNSLRTLHILKGGEDIGIPFRNILYLEQDLHRIKIALTDGSEIRYYGKLKELMTRLDESLFFSGHGSFAVNLMYVTGIDTHLRCFTLRGGINIPIRRESLAEARKKFDQYLFYQVRQIWNT